MEAIESCRTEALGGQVYHCTPCDQFRYSYHSCQNPHCPKCGNQGAARWLARQWDRLLPVPYFLVTFTLPDSLRGASAIKCCYAARGICVSSAMKEIVE